MNETKWLEDRIKERLEGRADLPSYEMNPLVILAIIQIILSIVKVCWGRGPQELRRVAAQRPRFARVAVQAAVRDELRARYGLGAYGRHHGPQITDTVLSLAAEASDQDFVAAYDLAVKG